MEQKNVDLNRGYCIVYILRAISFMDYCNSGKKNNNKKKKKNTGNIARTLKHFDVPFLNGCLHTIRYSF